ncbi:RHS repeat domain-containing protein, partial [Escherichia coli]
FSRVRQAHPSVAPQWVTRTNHAVSDLTGRPLMLFNSEGKTVWRPGQTSLWGLALSLPADTGYPDPRGELDPEAAPGLLYAGQWQDAESGLCYNRFRYYEPETGMYLVSDPLGLLGGEQTYRYVPNPLRWIDPLGLNKGASLSKMMNSSSDLMGVEKAAPELLEAISRKRHLIIALPGSDEFRMLEHFGAEASVLDMTIIVRSNPSKAAILEEFLHGTQEKLGIAEKLGRYGLGSAETHVKDFMIRHKKMLGLSDEDVAILKILKDKGL